MQQPSTPQATAEVGDDIKQLAAQVLAKKHAEEQGGVEASEPSAAPQKIDMKQSLANPSPSDTTMETLTFLQMAVAQGVSDIHFRDGYPPIVRKDGDILYTKLPPMTREILDRFLEDVVPKKQLYKLDDKMDFDFSFDIPGLARFRANWFYQMNEAGVVLRIIKHEIANLESLNMPTSLYDFCQSSKGIVIVTGPTGSGKSTTLAALLNHINETQSRHIITLEDPVEYVYRNKRSVITQRQLGLDTDTYPNGIKYSLRQDPDVILVGEMRDRQTINAALHAAETGHMVFSTLHTIDAVQTIHRIINAFEPHEREPMRKQLATVLQGTVSQRLVKKKDGGGRVPVAEIMKVTPAIRDYIERNQIEEIYNLLSDGSIDGMMSLNESLFSAYNNGWIDADTCLNTSENRVDMHQRLKGMYSGSNR